MTVWLRIPGYEKYEASDDGNVRRAVMSRGVKRLGTPLKHRRGPDDRPMVCVTDAAGKQRNRLIHRCVAEAFHGLPPTPQHQVAHSDGNKFNNAASNLRWATTQENTADKVLHGAIPLGEAHGMAVLTEPQVKEIRARYVRGNGAALAAEYGVCNATIWLIAKRRLWKHV